MLNFILPRLVQSTLELQSKVLYSSGLQPEWSDKINPSEELPFQTQFCHRTFQPKFLLEFVSRNTPKRKRLKSILDPWCSSQIRRSGRGIYEIVGYISCCSVNQQLLTLFSSVSLPSAAHWSVPFSIGPESKYDCVAWVDDEFIFTISTIATDRFTRIMYTEARPINPSRAKLWRTPQKSMKKNCSLLKIQRTRVTHFRSKQTI